MFYFEKNDFPLLNDYNDPLGPRLCQTQLGSHHWILKLRQLMSPGPRESFAEIRLSQKVETPRS
jgi:hypothetical protein